MVLGLRNWSEYGKYCTQILLGYYNEGGFDFFSSSIYGIPSRGFLSRVKVFF
jgi:hypothetical protein